jgi:hypothetical protein
MPCQYILIRFRLLIKLGKATNPRNHAQSNIKKIKNFLHILSKKWQPYRDCFRQNKTILKRKIKKYRNFEFLR